MHKVTDLESPVRDGHKRVRFTKHVMEFGPGDIADVPMDKFEHLCAERELAQGDNKFVKFRNAIPLDEALALDEELKNAKDLTVDEMKAAGRKNIVETPTDDAFAKALKTRSEKLHESEDEDDDVPRRKRGKKSREQGMTSNQLEGDAAQ